MPFRISSSPAAHLLLCGRCFAGWECRGDPAVRGALGANFERLARIVQTERFATAARRAPTSHSKSDAPTFDPLSDAMDGRFFALTGTSPGHIPSAALP